MANHRTRHSPRVSRFAYARARFLLALLGAFTCPACGPGTCARDAACSAEAEAGRPNGGVGGSGGMGGSGARDASLDGGSGGMSGDASVDSGDAADASDSGDASEVDASACAAGCTGNTSYCDPGTDLCVQCLEHSDCGDGERCSAERECVECEQEAHCTERECVECEQEAHCTELDAPYCDLSSHTCEPCLADAVCERFEETRECDEISGACVACTADTEDQHCGSFSCDREQGTCSSVEQGSLQACSACQADSECASGLGCVEHFFQGDEDQSLGSFCFPRKGTVGCADVEAVRRPYSQEIETRSIDRVESTYCLPTTSCAAIADAIRNTACVLAEDCGGANVNDGVCLDIGGGDKRCSYACTADQQCPQIGFTVCMGAPLAGVCVSMP